MINKLLCASLLLSASAGPVHACLSEEAERELVSAIESKFDVSVQGIGERCWGRSYRVYYRPAEPAASAGRRFSYLNGQSLLGELEEEELKPVLALAPEQMRALAEANTAFAQDVYETRSSIGVGAYHPSALPPSERISERGVLMNVDMPHCLIGYPARHSHLIGRIELPVADLEGWRLIGKTPFYRKGDFMRVLRASPSVLEKMRQDAAENAAALENEEYRESYEPVCGRDMESGNVIDWNAVQELR